MPAGVTALSSIRIAFVELARGDGANPGAAGYRELARLVDEWDAWRAWRALERF